MSSRQKGMTLVEVLVGMGILAVLIFASLSLTTSALHTTRMNIDRQFATEKAISILEELKAVAQNAAGGNVVVLDQYDDGVTTQDALTTQTGANPDDPVSGNVMGPHGWLYQRRVSVIRIGGQSNAGVRLVRVAVFRDDVSGMRLLAEVSSVIRTLATAMPQSQVYDVYAIAVENVPGWWVYTSSLVPFVQDAINELQDRNPGLNFRVHWINKLSYGRDEEYRPFINQANDADQTINSVYFYPGTLVTGNAVRNPPDLDEYYPVQIFQAHMNIDGTDSNNYNATTNAAPYALADQYNHAMRYYDEKARFNARVAAGLEDSTSPTYRLLLDDMIMNPNAYTNAILINLHGELFPFAPTRNYSDPAKAPDTVATAPLNLQNIRVVTHPEFLAYNAGTNINFRVYAYEAPTGSSAFGVLPLTVPITVVFPGIDLSGAGTLSVTRIEGGVAPTILPNCGSNIGYCASSALGVGTPATNMYAQVSVVTVGSTPNTLVKLFNTPLRHPKCGGVNCASVGFAGGVTNNAGLSNTYLLYNQQYIPAPMENFAQVTAQTPFGINLTTNSAVAKNTARWIISINGTNLTNILSSTGVPAVGAIPACAAPCSNTALAVETRIGDVAAGSLPTTGTMWPTRNQPPNLSRTYVWRGTNLWLYGDGTNTNLPNMPMSERYQLMGDPRHSPYADNKMPHTNNGGTWSNSNVNATLGQGYNRYFDDFEDGTNNCGSDPCNAGSTGSNYWPGYSYTVAGTNYGVRNDGTTNNDGYRWGTNNGQIELDVQRAFQTVRNALTSSQAVYTTMTGYSYYYIGIGGEIGYDAANQFSNSIPLNSKPYTGSSGLTTEQSIINGCATCGVKYVRQNCPGACTNYWWGMNWLGENYPDSAYMGTYAESAANVTAGTAGNLPTGTSSTSYIRVMRGAIAPSSGSTFILPAGTAFNLTSNDAAVRRTGGPGSTNLFWSGTVTSTFHHSPNNNNGNLIAEGIDIGNPPGYNFPLLNPVPNNRPFNINVDASGALEPNPSGNNPDTFLSAVYGPTFVASQQAQYYQQQGPGTPPGSALEALRNPTGNKVAFIVVNGLSPVGASGSSYIARWSFLTLIHSFFQGGLYPVAGTETGCAACTFRIHQLPRVAITYPNITVDLNNPASINIQWTATWKRWDGNNYTPAAAYAGFSETDAVQYKVMYSPDNGTTWKWCDSTITGAVQDPSVVDTTPPKVGMKSDLTAQPGSMIAANNFSWPTPAGLFPQGNYLIRVEAFRQNYPLHYAYHQFRAFIRR